MAQEKMCSFIICPEDMAELPQSQDLQTVFQKGSIEEKKKALKTLIRLISNDENYPRLLMPVLTNLQMIQDNELKKLLLLYWEVVEKTKVDGTVKDEITLACNAFRKDLLSPNEYIRGRTLRLVSKITILSILENLTEAIFENLNHRHFYVRRNAVMCLYAIYSYDGREIIEDCVDKIEELLINETDLSCKRNCFFLLFHLNQAKALAYLHNVMQQEDPVSEMGDIFQLVVLEMLRKLCKADPSQKPRLMNAIFTLANSRSSSVLFECANTITQLTTAPTAVKVAIQSYLNLLSEQNDNNVKIIVLSKIIALKTKYSKLIEDYLTEIMTTVDQQSSLEISQMVLNLATEQASQRNIKEIISFITKQMERQIDEKVDPHGAYEFRQLLIKCIHKLTVRFPDTIPLILKPLMERFLTFEKDAAVISVDSILFIREVIEKHPQHREPIFNQICQGFEDIRASVVMRSSLWIMGEYAKSDEEIKTAFYQIISNIGSLPLYVPEIQQREDSKEEDKKEEDQPKVITKTVILPDGSYGTETIYLNDPKSAKLAQGEDEHHLRKELIKAEDDYLASCLAVTLTKLVIKQKKLLKNHNQYSVDAIMVICNLLKTPKHKKGSDPDSKQRMNLCLKILMNPNKLKTKLIDDILAQQGRHIFSKFLERSSTLMNAAAFESKTEDKGVVVQYDEPIFFRQLKGKQGANDFDISDEIGSSEGIDELMQQAKVDAEMKVHQLTGYSDPIYVETFLDVRHYDILLKIVMINRTNKTLPNVNFEILTQGSLKLVDKPMPCTLRANQTHTMKASLKMNSTDNGVIFGYIQYDSASGQIANVVNINEIQIDFVNELHPAHCSDIDFMQKWAEYEWENKVQVVTGLQELQDYIDYFASKLNIKQMNPTTQAEIESGFVVANFYCKSKFEEDCLINVSIEKTSHSEGGRVGGLIRMRAKTEGMALCIGEKIKAIQ